MKNSVILTILVIYIGAIFIVGFLGQKLRIYNETKYVEQIECISDNFKKYDVNDSQYQKGYIGKISVAYQENLKIYVKCRVLPADATYKDLDYICGSKICTIEKDSDGYAILTFTDHGSVDLIVKSTDGKNTQIKIKIIATDTGSII